MADMLAFSAHLPEIEVSTGEVVVREGGESGPMWVLVSGSLDVLKGDVVVNRIVHPGAVIGEVSVLLGTPPSASVVASEPTVLRYAQDGQALLRSDPQITTLVAAGLADRVNFVTTYLADLKHQYGDAPGLAMVSGVLSQLSRRTGPPARSGSARDPDPEY